MLFMHSDIRVFEHKYRKMISPCVFRVQYTVGVRARHEDMFHLYPHWTQHITSGLLELVTTASMLFPNNTGFN